ncbi:MAG: AbrB/MazE/SpoVT family DNA-binding domain-containing protein [Chloroflexi bacterium]|nr:AbrB/MazE/SpoVT family DNA-binding domain-containing protein [Chloroflexota bacterium]
MITRALERRTVRLHRVGGSRSIVVPKEWLDRRQIGDEADIVLTEDAIVIEPHVEPAPSIEDEPEFAAFMSFLLTDALSRPQDLVDPADLLAQADEILKGVDPE